MLSEYLSSLPVKVDGGMSQRPQPYTKYYRQSSKVESGIGGPARDKHTNWWCSAKQLALQIYIELA